MGAAESNKNNFERTGRTLDKPMIFELILRGGGVLLAVSSIISSSVCLNKLISDATIQNLQGISIASTRATAGWILFLSLTACMYQTFTIFQLFSYVKLLYMKIPVGKSLWYLFPLMDLIINIIYIIGYLSAAITMAVYSYQWMKSIINQTRTTADSSSIQDHIKNYVLPVAVVFTCLLAFGCAARSVVNVAFILLAKIKYKWPTYFVSEN